MSGVLHASAIELSEEGVEASATTAVTATRSISHFSVNSPFFFALVDESSMVPLFMGVVTNPAPDDDGSMANDDPDGNNTVSDDLVSVSNQQDAELRCNKKELEEEDGDSSKKELEKEDDSSSSNTTNTTSNNTRTRISNNNTTSSSNITSSRNSSVLSRGTSADEMLLN